MQHPIHNGLPTYLTNHPTKLPTKQPTPKKKSHILNVNSCSASLEIPCILWKPKVFTRSGVEAHVVQSVSDRKTGPGFPEQRAFISQHISTLQSLFWRSCYIWCTRAALFRTILDAATRIKDNPMNRHKLNARCLDVSGWVLKQTMEILNTYGNFEHWLYICNIHSFAHYYHYYYLTYS